MEPLTTKRYVNIYTEANPNPNSLKFVANYLLTPEGASFDFPDVASAGSSPLAQSLFEKFDFIERVFVMNNFITVTKAQATDWMEVARPVKLFIQEYLENHTTVFTNEYVNQLIAEGNSFEDSDSEIIKKIKSVLEEYVKPAVESDGGAISFHSFDELTGQVKVLLQGSCSGCPSSTLTLKAGIENLLKRMVPEVKEVVAEGI